MSDFDPTVPLTMNRFKTVLGHGLTAGTPLTIVKDPREAGEIDEALARRLFVTGLAVAADERRPTPVETEEQAKAREASELLAELPPMQDGEAFDIANAPADLVTWQADDKAAGKKAGAKITRDDLDLIADREEILIESDDNKSELVRKIVEGRAAKVAAVLTSNEPFVGDTATG